MADKTVIVETPPEEAPSAIVAADVEAARANLSATAATEAAAGAMALAEVQAARVIDAASSEISSYEERLNECASQIEQHGGQLKTHREETAAQLASLSTQLSSILQKLEKTPEPSPSPAPNPGEPLVAEALPAEPEPAARRKAHRWI